MDIILPQVLRYLEGEHGLKVALLAERHARGPDGQRMRSPQLGNKGLWRGAGEPAFKGE